LHNRCRQYTMTSGKHDSQATEKVMNSYTTRPSRKVSVAVEYTARGQKTVKTFEDMYAARRFFVAKEKAGAAPKVVKPA